MKRFAVIALAIAILAAGVSAIAAAPNSDGEEIPADEPQAILEVRRLIEEHVGNEAKKDGRAFRDAHRKHHGCVGARFSVRQDIPEPLRR